MFQTNAERTIEAFKDFNNSPLCDMKDICMKVDGLKVYGYIKSKDILDDNMKISLAIIDGTKLIVNPNGETYEFESIEDMVNSGWEVN